MTTFVKHEARRPSGAKFAWFCGIIWAALIALMWWAYRDSDGTGGGFLNFVARFHVVVVHFPIGIIVIAFVMEVLSHFTAFAHLSKSIGFMLWLGLFSSIGATVMGYLLMSVEDEAGRAMDLHMYFGLAVVVFILLALVLYIAGKTALYNLSLLLAVFTTLASGHFGGALVHDGEYLTEFAPEPVKPLLSAGLGSSHSPPAEEGAPGGEETPEVPLPEQIVYADFVSPILDAKCNECHDENKIKGKLRMDTHELLLAGSEGSDYPTILPGNADESEAIVRVTLEDDDDDFMPPKGDPLTPEEIELLSLWINAGASETGTIAELGDDPNIQAIALAVAAQQISSEDVADLAVATYDSVWDTLTPEEQETRMKEVNAAAERYHFSVMPISAEDDRLRVNVINASKEFGDEQLALLEPVADRVVWLDLARSQVTDSGLDTVGKMRALERLHLENTKITDSGIAKLAALKELEYINLYGTEVGNPIFETFKELPRLKKVYVWQTKVDPAEARSFERSVNLEINTGVDLAVTSPPVEEKAEPAPAEKAPEKKPEAKPAPKPEAKPAAKTEPAKPAPKPEAKPAAKTAPAKPKETPAPAKPKTRPAAPKKADTPPAKPKETKPADQPKPAPKAEPKPAAPKAPAPKPAEKPAPKADTPPAPKPETAEKKA